MNLTERQGITMTKQEFLGELKSCLAGRVDDREMQTQISYYESYIIQEINSGKTIDEVMDNLGSPRLIAKTIIQAYMAKSDPISRQYRNNANTNTDTNANRWGENNSDSNTKDGKNKLTDKIWKIITLTVVLFTIFLAVRFVFVLVKFLLPIIFVIAVLYMIIKLITS